MEMLKEILIDSLNGFALKDIPFFIFQLLVAGLLSHLFQIIWQRKFKQKALSSFAIKGTAFALLSVFAKYSVAFAVLALAVVMWMSKHEAKNKLNATSSLIIGIIGVGVGSGNIVLTGIGFLVLIAILFFVPSIQNDEAAD